MTVDLNQRGRSSRREGRAPLRASVCALLITIACSLGAQPEALADAPRPANARKALHLISYVASDYGGAVRDGKVVDAVEYDEQVTLLREAEAALSASAALPARERLMTELEAARHDVGALASSESVSARIARVSAVLSASAGVIEPPAQRPSRERGEALYREHCARCHGDDGSGQTEAARQLKPPPADLLDPSVAEWLSPLRVAMTTEFGVAGTGMVPFDGLSRDARWDVAFYVTSLPHRASPAATEQVPVPSLGELATLSDHELRAALLRGGVSMDDAEPIVASLRAQASFSSAPLSSPQATAREALRSAEALAVVGDEAGAKIALHRADEALAAGPIDVRGLEALARARDALSAAEQSASGEDLRRAASQAMDALWVAEVAMARPGSRRPWLPALLGGVAAMGAALLVRRLRRSA